MHVPNPWYGPVDLRPRGSDFHELVVLPTLAPHLARPAQGMAGPAEQREASVEIVDNEPVAGAVVEPGAREKEAEADQVPDRLFFVLVTLQWVERIPAGRSVKMSKQQASKQVSAQTAVLKLTRAEFIRAALSAHGYEDRYAPGPVSGPGIRVFWVGYPGGKTSAPTITTDDDWRVLRRQLAATRVSVNAISVVFDLEAMEGFKTRMGPLGLVGPDNGAELTYGTRVPSAESYSQETRAIAQAIDDIKSHWDCAEHGGHCYLDEQVNHIALNRFRLKQWGAAMVAENRAATEPPPQPLLLEWRGGSIAGTGTAAQTSASAAKPRGRLGPNTQAATAPADTNALLLSLATPLMTMAMQQMAAWRPSSPSRSHARVRPRSPSPPARGDHASSPPPAIEDELRNCLEAFGQAKHLAPEAIARALAGLDEAAFSPDTLDQPSVARLQELTGLPEGQVYQLRRFAAAWAGKIETKRARRG